MVAISEITRAQALAIFADIVDELKWKYANAEHWAKQFGTNQDGVLKVLLLAAAGEAVSCSV